MMVFSICSMVTAGALMASTQASSQGAGQRRPVNSGKLLVAMSCLKAASQRSWYTSSFQSGMRFPRGQPAWQVGTPQSMQRAAWSRIVRSGKAR